MAKNRGLGRGLDSLFTVPDEKKSHKTELTQEETSLTELSELDNTASGKETIGTRPFSLRLSDIEPDKEQPRKKFDIDSLSSLADSISRHGVLQPLIVRKADTGKESNSTPTASVLAANILAGKYKIVSGERRWRAAKMAGLTEVPVIIKDLSESETAAIMLVENLQREDLGPIEEAKGLSRLIDEFDLTQEQAASIVGISRPALTNALRLLSLPEQTINLLEQGSISAGHARALLTLGSSELINKTAQIITDKGMSVRETERYVRLLLAKENEGKSDKLSSDNEDISLTAYMNKLEDKVSSHLGRKTRIIKDRNNKQAGKLELSYYNNTDLEKLLSALCGEDIFEE